MEDKAKGGTRETAGAMTGDEDLKAEGRAQQRKGDAAKQEAAQKERTRRAEAAAKQTSGQETDRSARTMAC
jgi:uncharacterized protein YjbJ (UPF0337 family)